MLGNEKTAGIEHQDAQIGMAIEFFGAVRAEHSRADHDGVKRNTAVIYRFIPRVANVAAHRIDREVRLLNRDGLVGFLQSIDHFVSPEPDCIADKWGSASPLRSQTLIEAKPTPLPRS